MRLASALFAAIATFACRTSDPLPDPILDGNSGELNPAWVDAIVSRFQEPLLDERDAPMVRAVVLPSFGDPTLVRMALHDHAAISVVKSAVDFDSRYKWTYNTVLRLLSPSEVTFIVGELTRAEPHLTAQPGTPIIDGATAIIDIFGKAAQPKRYIVYLPQNRHALELVDVLMKLGSSP